MYNYRPKRTQKHSQSLEDKMNGDDASTASSSKAQQEKNKFSNLPKSNYLQFVNEKRQALEGKLDRSKKGHLDEAIRPLVEMINADERYYTTSCCSGRIIVSGETSSDSELTLETPKNAKKKSTKWIFCAHGAGEFADTITEDITDAILPIWEPGHKEEPPKYESIIFKFEPVIFHIRAVNIEAASALLQAGLKAGFRNSGIVTSSSSSCIVALRHTLQMEAPLVVDGRAVFTKAYIEELVKVANRKMAANEAATFRLEGALLTVLHSEDDEVDGRHHDN